MSRRAQRSKLCPVPSKVRHYTEEEALEAGRSFEAMCIRLGRPFDPVYVYRCDCRMYHVTRRSVGVDSTFNRKANP